MSRTSLILTALILFTTHLSQVNTKLVSGNQTSSQQRFEADEEAISQFVVKVKGGLGEARRIARELNIKLIKQVFENSDYYLFQRDSLKSENEPKSNRSKRNRLRSRKPRLKRAFDTDEISKLKSFPTVEWVQQQVPKSRSKRDFQKFQSNDVNFNSNLPKPVNFNDPMWFKLWYINPQEDSIVTMRVKEAWKKGFTGKGVVVTILDDGLEWDHPDIIKNYDYRASLDINDSDNDPKPRYDRYNYNKHGTRCAGEIAAMADNDICSVGVAYNSRIGGIRMLDGEVTDLVEATALSFNRDYIDIYSASWGPDDDGKTVDGPGFLAQKAIEDGIKYGRKGLGSIYVWASGNGGKDDDNCNCDGYTNSIYTISVSSATQNGNIPWYSEACSSTLASTFSSGSYEENQIITTDLRKGCTEAHTGTSASAPLAAAIIALTLEANPNLSWRDIQHLIIETSRPENLSTADWQENGVNRLVSHSFGYGMMDASAMVDLAKKWTNVPTQRKCVIESSENGHHQKPILIPKGDRLIIELYSTGCKDSSNEINYLEHVQAVITIQSNTRGTLVVHLRSPMGTNSTLLDKRILDQSTESFNKWPFTSVHMWGEKPQGIWTVEIKNNARNTTYINLSLILYGTKDSPQKRAVSTNELYENYYNQKNEQNEMNHENDKENDNQQKPLVKSSSSSIFNIVQSSDQKQRKAKLSNSNKTSKIYKQNDILLTNYLFKETKENFLKLKNFKNKFRTTTAQSTTTSLEQQYVFINSKKQPQDYDHESPANDANADDNYYDEEEDTHNRLLNENEEDNVDYDENVKHSRFGGANDETDLGDDHQSSNLNEDESLTRQQEYSADQQFSSSSSTLFPTCNSALFFLISTVFLLQFNSFLFILFRLPV